MENLSCGSGEGWLRVQVYWRTRITINESQTNHRGISLRSASRAQEMAEARTNARLGLMIAIGEVQKSMGIDQRISAPSGILDASADSAAADGLAKPHLTGVWNARDATQETLTRDNTNPPNYSRDKPNFQRWLVSNANSEAVA